MILRAFNDIFYNIYKKVSPVTRLTVNGLGSQALHFVIPKYKPDTVELTKFPTELFSHFYYQGKTKQDFLYEAWE